VKHHAKRPTAGSNQRQATGLGRMFRGSFAGRGASSGAKGSGAPSRRRPLGVLAALSAVLVTALIVATAFADKEVIDYFGASGSKGGEFETPRDIAVNLTGAGPADAGDIYVAEEFGHRVQRFDAEGNFISAWGADVSLPDGGTDYEVCTVAAECQRATNSGGNGTTAGNGSLNRPQSVAVDNDTGNVYVSDRDNRRVNVYTGDGTFISSWGFDVDATEAATEYEVCPAANVCKIGEAGAGAGQIGSTFTGGALGIAVSPADGEAAVGKVFLADSQNRRVNTYDLDGQNPSSFGSETEFGTTQPRKVAVDSRGVVYASDSNNGAEVERYDTEDANGGGIGFLAPLTAENSTPAGPLLPGFSTATSGLAVDPDSDAGGPDEDVLYVLRDPSSGNTVVQQFDTPSLAPTPTAVDDEHGQGAGFTTVNGLGLNDASGQLFVSATTSVTGLSAGHRVYVIDDALPPPVPVLEPITVKADKTATFTATIDPEGGHVSGCTFEYSTDPGFTGAVEVEEPDCLSLDPNGGPQTVSEEVSGLNPNTTYHVRFELSRTFIPNSAVTTATQSFATDQVPPYVTDVIAIDVGDTSARLAGQVNPANSEASYVFEYGPTPALGNTTPVLAIGGGNEEIVVSQVVKGLAKDSDYLFRLVATNVFGTTTGATQSFHTRAVPLPNPANRAYEQVSPVHKNWGDAISSSPNIENRSPTFVGYDGEGVAYGSINGFAEDPAGQVLALQTQYASRRGPGGWQTQPLAPPACANDLDNPVLFVLFLQHEKTVSANVEAATIPQREAPSCTQPPLDPGAILPAANLYRVDLLAQPDSYDLLVPEPDPFIPLELDKRHGRFRAASDDYSHIVYESNGQQTLDAPAGNFRKLYEWDEGTLRLVSIDTSDEPFESSSSVTIASAGENVPLGINGGFPDMGNVVSADGERIFVINDNELYMREGGTTTHHVSESECTAACGPSGGKLARWADLEGDMISFTTTEKLTDDDPTDAGSGNEDLYVYRHSPNPASEANLTLVSHDAEPADGSEGDVLGVAGMSDDGEVVYFIADNQLVAGEPTGLGEENFYRWDWNGGAPTLEYLATARQDEQFTPENSITIERDHMERRVSRDGSALMIETSKRLLPAADADADHDVYLWREGEGWSCVSCQVPGEASGGPSTTGRVGVTGTSLTGSAEGVDRELASAISEDGERVVFETQDALVAGDANGPCTVKPGLRFFPCTDVYEWHDGRLALITPGTASTDAGLVGISESGRDVVFYTRQPLVGWDVDNFIDIYNARIGGGFPEPPPQPPECEGEGCRTEGSDAPAIAGAGSAVFQGPGNRTTGANGRCPANKLRRGKRCLPLRAIARKRCRRLSGPAKRGCIRKQTRRLRRAQRRRARARAANTDGRASR